MRRIALIWLVVAVAIGGAVGVIAFRRASVGNAAQVKVVATNSAMLAMDQVDTTIASGAASNQLQLSFPAQQPNSTYTYGSVFSVTNRTPRTVSVSIASVSGETSGVHLQISYGPVTAPTYLWQNGVAVGAYSLPSSNTLNLNVAVKVDAGISPSATPSLGITVQGQ